VRSIAVMIVTACVAVTCRLPQASAHSKLSSAFKKNYRLRSVSCHACHLKEAKEKKKDKLTPFGKTLVKLLDGKMITKRVEALEGKSKEEKDRVWADITKEFLAALRQLDAKEAPSGKKFAEAIRAGEIEGARPRK
jgi:hypothetical protein